MIDLRSDTVTRPSHEMLQAIMNAEVGDDVFGEDPTVNLLQEEVASMFGKEAGLFVPSGVMGNQLAIKAHTDAGDEVLVEGESHIFHYETTAPALISRVQLYSLRSENGVVDIDSLRDAIRPDAYYMPRSRLLCLENTHNRYGGAVYPIEQMREICKVARTYDLRIHLDGARIWNASVATGTPLSEYVNIVDTISVCFSKGLGAPVGSMLLGDKDTIQKAHRFRKIIGGGMRQVGILAAAARYAVHNNFQRLAEDHKNTEEFIKIISEMDRVSVFPQGIKTNMCIIDITKITRKSVEEVLFFIEENNVRLTSAGKGKIRAVMHLNVTKEEVIQAAKIVRNVLTKLN